MENVFLLVFLLGSIHIFTLGPVLKRPSSRTTTSSRKRPASASSTMKRPAALDEAFPTSDEPMPAEPTTASPSAETPAVDQHVEDMEEENHTTDEEDTASAVYAGEVLEELVNAPTLTGNDDESKPNKKPSMHEHAAGSTKSPVLKKPSASSKISKPVLPHDSERAPLKATRGSPKICQTIDKKNGWKLLQYETPKGRRYWKWLSPTGAYFFSEVKAKDHGYEN